MKAIKRIKISKERTASLLFTYTNSTLNSFGVLQDKEGPTNIHNPVLSSPISEGMIEVSADQ